MCQTSKAQNWALESTNFEPEPWKAQQLSLGLEKLCKLNQSPVKLKNWAWTLKSSKSKPEPWKAQNLSLILEKLNNWPWALKSCVNPLKLKNWAWALKSSKSMPEPRKSPQLSLGLKKLQNWAQAIKGSKKRLCHEKLCNLSLSHAKLKIEPNLEKLKNVHSL